MNILFFLNLGITYGFLLSPHQTVYPGIYTHDEITEKGVFAAVKNFIIDNQLVVNNKGTSEDIICRYFGTDLDGYKRFQGVIDGFTQVFVRDKRDPRASIHVYCEQIQMAHDHIIQMKNDIKHLMTEEDLLTDIITVIREKIAHALYTLQNFYSNTNWIEMKGSIVYENFGKPGYQLMNIAPSSVDMCRNCDSVCDDNLLVHDMLTSGYISDVNIAKPLRQNDTTTGKCSHGGISDDTTSTVATGGINKETNDPSLSPHYLLHHQAAMAAIKATELLFVSNESSILSVLGKSNFQKVMEIDSAANYVQTSLAFNIATTSSMSDEINFIAAMTIDMVMSVIDSVNRPADYVLVTFNGQVNLTRRFTTTNGGKMIEQLKTLTAYGDNNVKCPECAIQGLLKAIQSSRNNSRIYTFTDFDPNDKRIKDQVLSAAKARNMRLVFIIFGECVTCRKQRHNNHGQSITGGEGNKHSIVKRRSGTLHSLQSLANQTGGVIHEVSKQELKNGSAIDKIKADIETDFPSSSVQLDAFTLRTNARRHIPMYIDGDLSVLKIQITGSRSIQASINLPNLTDIISTHSSDVLVVNNIDSLIVSVQSPPPGLWTLTARNNDVWSVNVTGQSVVDFDVKLYTADGTKLTTQPISGDNYTVLLNFFNLNENTTLSTVFVTSENGSVLESYELITSSNTTTSAFSAVIKMPNINCRLHINGTDPSGNIFRRMLRKDLRPVNVMLSLEPIFGDVYISVAHNVSFHLANFGSENQTYIVKVSDNLNAFQPPTSKTLFVKAGQTYYGYFTFQGSASKSLLRYTVIVTLPRSSEILQSLSNTVLFTTKKHPVCSVTIVDGSCPTKSLNTRDCSRYNWTASGKISYSGVTIKSIFISNEASISYFEYDNFTTHESPLSTNVSGTCCNPAVSVNVVDEDGYIARCDFNFGDPNNIRIVQHPSCVITTSDKCIDESLNNKNCSMYKWDATAKVRYSEVDLLPLELPTSANDVKFSNTNITQSPVYINASSTCCNPSVYVNTTDSDGHFGRCHFYFADPNSIRTVVEHPVCVVKNASGGCPSQSLNTRDCPQYHWSASGEITYFGVELNSISTNMSIVTSFIYDNFTKAISPIKVNASGSCCHPSVFIYVEDKKSYKTKCNYTFAKPEDIKDVKANQGLSKAGIIGIAVAAAVVVVSVAAIMCGVLHWKKKQNKEVYSGLDTSSRNPENNYYNNLTYKH